MVTERSTEIDGHLVVWREAEGAPVLYLHGVPDSGEMWTEFLEASGGYAPDLPGFGRSGKRADFPYDIDGYAEFLGRFVDALGLRRISLVVHDWGAVGLAMAARRPGLVERLVAIDPVPFVPGFRWHRAARLWRRPGIGEIVMGLQTPFAFRRAARGMPRELADRALAHMDHGTQRAILRLYRSADPPALAAAGAQLGRIDAQALVVWGERDVFLDVGYAEPLASALRAELVVVPGAGHWPWTDDADVKSRILRFLDREDSPRGR